MKYLLLIMLMLPTVVLADFCNVGNSDNLVTVQWTAPTHREKNSEGVEKVLSSDEIKGYIIDWNDEDKPTDGDPKPSDYECSLQINISNATSYQLKLQSGTNIRIRMRTMDNSDNPLMSTFSNAIFVTTTGVKPEPVSDSPPNKIENMVIEAR